VWPSVYVVAHEDRERGRERAPLVRLDCQRLDAAILVPGGRSEVLLQDGAYAPEKNDVTDLLVALAEQVEKSVIADMLSHLSHREDRPTVLDAAEVERGTE